MRTLTTFVIIISLLSCGIIKPKNPEFYCKVNGKTYTPSKDTSPVGGVGSEPLRLTFNAKDGILFLSARNTPQEISFIVVMKSKSMELGDFPLLNDISSSKGYFISNLSESPLDKSISNVGTFSITKIEGYNIWGTFEFTCKSNKTNTEYKITKGEFNNISYF